MSRTKTWAIIGGILAITGITYARYKQMVERLKVELLPELSISRGNLVVNVNYKVHNNSSGFARITQPVVTLEDDKGQVIFSQDVVNETVRIEAMSTISTPQLRPVNLTIALNPLRSSVAQTIITQALAGEIKLKATIAFYVLKFGMRIPVTKEIKIERKVNLNPAVDLGQQALSWAQGLLSKGTSGLGVTVPRMSILPHVSRETLRIGNEQDMSKREEEGEAVGFKTTRLAPSAEPQQKCCPVIIIC